jgi:hypothetical protein
MGNTKSSSSPGNEVAFNVEVNQALSKIRRESPREIARNVKTFYDFDSKFKMMYLVKIIYSKAQANEHGLCFRFIELAKLFSDLSVEDSGATYNFGELFASYVSEKFESLKLQGCGNISVGKILGYLYNLEMASSRTTLSRIESLESIEELQKEVLATIKHKIMKEFARKTSDESVKAIKKILEEKKMCDIDDGEIEVE